MNPGYLDYLVVKVQVKAVCAGEVCSSRLSG
jgi:hypothetical protein